MGIRAYTLSPADSAQVVGPGVVITLRQCTDAQMHRCTDAQMDRGEALPPLDEVLRSQCPHPPRLAADRVLARGFGGGSGGDGGGAKPAGGG
eukprot:CAMPEP_0173296414 /NCGR_PEP_ID=MMETSP1143-20121109/14942_1 /TAXON_ID=483371 /ORGANISM="non described non described, Strain CCMP2298" /LENGTH=91 /DNA_ID=CAMNT_0014236253 /DNA_START=249 /DNA_END=521 /DNA_ORIENTATION=-